MGHYSDLDAEMREEIQEELTLKFREERLFEYSKLEKEDWLQLHYEIEPNINKDGDDYGYTVIFDSEKSPKNILDKIKNLECGCQLLLPPSFFDIDEFDDDKNVQNAKE